MVDQPLTPKDDYALAAEFVIGLLPHEERLAAKRRLRVDQDFAEIVTSWEAKLEGLNTAYGRLEPPLRVKTRIDQRLFQTRRTLMSGLGWMTGLATAMAVMIALVAVQWIVPEDNELLATLESETATIVLSVESGSSDIDVEMVSADLPEGSVYELWLLVEGAAPLSLGTFAGTETFAATQRLSDGASLAVSVEPLGGSSTGAPTGPVIAVGVLQDA